VYPIILSLRDRRAVVIGGGAVAERKVRGLREAGAQVTVISPTLSDELALLAAAGDIGWEARLFAFGDCAGAALAFAATDDVGINAAVVVDARKHGVLVNDASDAARGDFVTPAVHRSGGLTVTIDSGGLSPSFTARIRDELALQVDARYARAAATLGALRARVLAVVPIERRAAVMAHFAERDIDDLASMPHGAVEHEVERAVDTLGGVKPGLPPTLVCASRASALAMWQTRSIMAQLASAGIASTVLNITTRGDAVQDRSLAAIGTDSLFVKELELALRDGRADYAVHSCKDLPSTLPDDMTLAAVTVREDPRDAYCSERYPTFEELPAGARVGTSSPRRRAQLSALRPDLRFDDIRGNVDTRLRKLRDGDYDAIILASAGMRRLELRATFTVPFPVDVLVPAVAQGALAIEMRDGDRNAARIGSILNDPHTDLAVRAERAFLRTLRGGCQAPVGAHASYDGKTLRMQAAIAAPDGSAVIRDGFAEPIARIEDGETAAVTLANAMLAAGGSALLASVVPPAPAEPGALAGLLFLLGRTGDAQSKIATALREEGAEVVEAVDGAAAAAALAGRTPNAVLVPSSGSVRAITEYLATLRDNGGRPMVVAMGPSSAATAGECGWPPDVVAPDADIASFVQTVTRTLLENAP
jgi:hydroxymethylbilane synthase